MKDKILEILKQYSVQIDNWNNGIIEDDFEAVEDELIKMFKDVLK